MQNEIRAVNLGGIYLNVKKVSEENCNRCHVISGCVWDNRGICYR